LLQAGDTLVAHSSLFFGVARLMDDYLSKLGIRVRRVDMRDPDQLRAALAESNVRAVYFEPICNPDLSVVNAVAVIKAARDAGVLCIIDNTVLTPCFFRPLATGADVVLHSASKFLGGHGDAIGGVVTAAEPKTADKIRDGRRILGTCLSPMNAFLLSRGVNTLPLRVRRHSENARVVAEWLSGRDWVESVSYPGLPGRQHDVLQQFASGFGGLVSFRLRAELERHEFARSLRRIGTRYSFGEPRSSILLQGWTDVIRLSVGWEDPVKITDDLQQAFLVVRESADTQGTLLIDRPLQHPSRVG
jgi:cystathionine beta-lyase/cystathionine gamma-synthase